MSQKTMDLREFLVSAELDSYYTQLHDSLKVASVTHIKYVDDQDLAGIGMSKPEIRRLRQYYKKACPQGALGKLRKIWGKNESGVGQSISAAERPGSVKPANRHLIAEDAISIQKTIGTGEFGVVQQAVWTNEHGERLPVAVKCLSKDRLKTQMAEFLLEAANMCSIDHAHIVQLHGVVLSSDCLMLVTELAPMRTLLDCLQDKLLGHTFSVSLLCELALQIADGMAYLEKRRLIHRDLAARNILVFAKDKIKVSDFGLSRALGVEKDYYQSQPNSSLVLPIAWCAPECINYLKFTSASDVWSFGVTLWEMFTGGLQPWEGMTGLEIMQAVDEPEFRRLQQPERCPDDWYQLMLCCWAAEPNDRPKFSELFLISLTQIKPMRVIASRNVSTENSDLVLELKTNDVIVVLSKTAPSHEHLNVANMWKGIVERTRQVGYFDRVNTAPYIEIPSIDASLLRTRTARPESSRFSLRPSKKLHAGLIGLPQNDLRHIGHVGYDGAVFGDVSFIGDNYRKLPIKVSSVQTSQGDVMLTKPTNGSVETRPKTFSGSDRKAVSVSSIETTATKQDDDFDDFQLPDLSMSFDFGSSLMDEVMKSLGSSTSDSNDIDKASSSSAEVSPPQNIRASERAAETNGEAQLAMVQVVASVASPEADSASDTESDESEDTSSSESTVSADDNDVEDDADVTRNSQTTSSPEADSLVTAVVKSSFVPKPVPGSATVTTELDEYSGSSRQHPHTNTSSPGISGLQAESLWLRRTSIENTDSGSGCLDKNGFSSDATAAYDELVGSKRRGSGSSSDRSTGQSSWRTSSELSSSTELKGAGGSGLRLQRSTNQNIRVPQGIPGRDSVSRKPFVNPMSSSAASAVAAASDESDFDTNPLRRLRDSQSGFTKPVFRPTNISAVAPRSTEPLPPSSNNLNVNLSFFDKLKEQEQLRKV